MSKYSQKIKLVTRVLIHTLHCRGYINIHIHIKYESRYLLSANKRATTVIQLQSHLRVNILIIWDFY